MLDRATFDRHFQSLLDAKTGATADFLREHEPRFFQLFQTLGNYVGDMDSPRVLEVGPSPVTPLYKTLFPHIRLTTVDQPVEIGGSDERYARQDCQADAHHNVDLNTEPLIVSDGGFDFIVFRDILQTITFSPVQMMEELIALLSPNGYLCLTAPNAFSLDALEKIRARKTPLPTLPRREEALGPGTTIREYALNELVDHAIEAGGRVIVADYSARSGLEFEHRETLRQHPYLHSHLTLMVMPKSSSKHRAITAPGMTGAFDPLLGNLESHIESERLLTEKEGRIAALEHRLARYEDGRFSRLIRRLAGTLEE